MHLPRRARLDVVVAWKYTTSSYFENSRAHTMSGQARGGIHVNLTTSGMAQRGKV